MTTDEDPKEKGFFNQPRKGGKSYWDWLDLISKLAIPIVVVGVTIGFGWWQVHLADVQHQQDQQSALDQQQATILQTYIDNIQDLMLNRNLRKSNQTDDVATLARVQTLAALRGLDPARKGFLVQFLDDAGLISIRNHVIDLTDAKLDGADLMKLSLQQNYLRGANLSRANLHMADLYLADLSLSDDNTPTNLSGADLSSTFLCAATLKGANLSNANLSNAKLCDVNFVLVKNFQLPDNCIREQNKPHNQLFLCRTNLSGANLSRTNLSGADLSGVLYLTQQQLDQVYTCKGATLPPGLTCHHNQ